MNLEEIEASVKEVLISCLQVPGDQLKSSSTLADLRADSLARIEIVLALEDTFKLTIPDEDAVKFNTLSDVIAYIQGRVIPMGPSERITTETGAQGPSA